MALIRKTFDTDHGVYGCCGAGARVKLRVALLSEGGRRYAIPPYASFLSRSLTLEIEGEEMKVIINFRAISIALLLLIPLPAIAGEARTFIFDYFACQNRENFERLNSYFKQDDMEAVKKLSIPWVSSGECIMFHSGEKVFVEDRAIFSGLIKVRRQGDVAEYWTNLDAVPIH